MEELKHLYDEKVHSDASAVCMALTSYLGLSLTGEFRKDVD